MAVRIISTKCSEEQQKEDMPELKKLHAQALKTEMMWEFFGGTLTLQNGNRYQVNHKVDEDDYHIYVCKTLRAVAECVNDIIFEIPMGDRATPAK